ncbi:uncharacterized protein LOC144457697 [Phascolarctos cinereus]
MAIVKVRGDESLAKGGHVSKEPPFLCPYESCFHLVTGNCISEGVSFLNRIQGDDVLIPLDPKNRNFLRVGTCSRLHPPRHHPPSLSLHLALAPSSWLSLVRPPNPEAYLHSKGGKRKRKSFANPAPPKLNTQHTLRTSFTSGNTVGRRPWKEEHFGHPGTTSAWGQTLKAAELRSVRGTQKKRARNSCHTVDGIVEGDILLALNVSQGTEIQEIEWRFNSEKLQLLSLQPGSHSFLWYSPLDRYKKRLDAMDNGSLIIRNVTLKDSGLYEARVLLISGVFNVHSFALSIYEPVNVYSCPLKWILLWKRLVLLGILLWTLGSRFTLDKGQTEEGPAKKLQVTKPHHFD